MTRTRHVIHLPNVDEAMRILLCAEDSDGSLGAVEMRMGPGESGPPLHLHRIHAESFYVLEGEMTLRVGDARITDGPGLWATAAAGVPHTLANFSAEPARVLCLFSPGGFERRFRRMLASDPERAGLAELAEAEQETELLGPPMEPPPS
jgi:mannose-6-phosphate isomerase-like protein (cupin superfamily)